MSKSITVLFITILLVVSTASVAGSSGKNDSYTVTWERDGYDLTVIFGSRPHLIGHYKGMYRKMAMAIDVVCPKECKESDENRLKEEMEVTGLRPLTVKVVEKL